MEVKKLSASSLQAADMCLARFHADRDAGYGATMKSVYALNGSTVHDTLENYVKIVHMEHKLDPSLQLLLNFYNKYYMKHWETAELSGSWYDTGIQLLTKWYERTDFSYFTVVSLEQKKYFDVKTSIGIIPITYIIDRLDYLGNGIWRVIDYKTSNELLTPELLFKKIQAKIYALAMQIELKDSEEPVEEIWVEFDMLRFSPVQVVFKREDNANSYRMLQRAAERIIEAKDETEEDVQNLESLNPQCGFCIRKTSCSAIQRNISVGGAFALETLENLVNRRALLEYQRKAAEAASNELEPIILARMESEMLLEYDTDMVDVTVGVSQRRTFDVDQIIRIIGQERFYELGGKQIITAADFDKMCKSLTPAEAATLKNEAVDLKFGEPKVNLKMKGSFAT